MNFCPNCGADCGETGRPDRSAVSDRDVLEYRITKAIEAGWELEHDFGDHAVMIRRNFGGTGTHFVVALFTFWWTGGVGNALYALYRYYGHPDRVVLRPDHVDASAVRSAGTDTDSGIGSVGRSIVLWLGTLIFLAFATASSTLFWSAVFAGFAVAFALSGVGALPPVKKRLAKRRSITTNGWNRVVEERSVTDPDEPCTSCASPISRGIERNYREEFTLLGVPIDTKTDGTNHYCRECANAEFEPPTVPDLDADRSRTEGESADPDVEVNRER